MKREVPLLLALAFAATAQVRFEVPRLGYVHDQEAKALRMVSGVAGAATLENALDSGAAIERAWISPRGFAVTQGKSESGIRYWDWTRNVQRELVDSVDAVALSTNGRYFAVLGGGAVEIWDGEGPSRKSRFEAANARAVAVSDDGAASLIVTSTGLSLWQQDRLQQIWTGEAIRGADFLANSRDFAAYDSGRNKILLMRAGAMTEIDTNSRGAQTFALGGDSRIAVLGGENSIELIDLNGGVSSTLTTDSAVESLARSGANGDLMQVRFRGDLRTALLEWAGLGSPQIEFLTTAAGGAQ